MLMRGKVCPRCAERVKTAARVCRYCGHQFPLVAASGGVDLSKPYLVPARRSRTGIYALAVAVAVMVALALGYAMAPRAGQPQPVGPMIIQREPAPIVGPAASIAEPLLPGQEIEWTADTAPPEVTRLVGPYLLRITHKVQDDTVAPLVTLSVGGRSVTMTGEQVGTSYTHRIGVIQNLRGAPPVVMLQSFSGGAHCCNVVQLAGASGGGLKIVDLGSWDGERVGLPADTSGDGVADFVFRDDAFLYAFAPYAMSYAPPRILNVVGGREVDVSDRPAFRSLFAKEAAQAGETCRSGGTGADRNGACASYVAAARIGRLEQAWSEMLRSYATDEDWQYPQGCRVASPPECPDMQRITYGSYPEALLAFLKERRYVGLDWLPPVDTPQPSQNEAAPGEAALDAVP